jgi:glycosyltransferase involved in cell wall biosynthesis
VILRILFCNYEYPPLGGGGGVINALLAEELAKKHDVTVLTSRCMGLPEESTENGVKIVRLPVMLRKQQTAASLASLLTFVVNGLIQSGRLSRKHTFDVINTHFVLPTGPVGQRLATIAGIPNILTVHGGDLYDPSKFLSPHRHLIFRVMVRSLLKKATTVVAQSNNTIQNVHRYYVEDLPVELIPLGISRPRSIRGDRKKYNIEEDETVLVSVGRLVARKGLQQLIDIFSKLGNERVRLVIIGSGPEEPALRNIVNERNISHRVIFSGQVDEQEKLELLDIADIYVSTSQHEGFGLVFLEGMAAGLPVVCYDHGGQTDFLEDGATGFVIKLNDTEQFRAGLVRLIEDAQLRDRMSAECLRSVEEYYIENCAQKYEDLFMRVISDT